MHHDKRPEGHASATRREFLQAMTAASMAALMAAEPQRVVADETAAAVRQIAPKADACILLWMGGGMAAPETFDPKRYQPFEVGLPVDKVMSTFPAIDTAVDNIKISQGLEHIAKFLDRGTLIRSLTSARSWAHFPFAASVPLAHWLRTAANGGCAAYRSVDGSRAGAGQSRHAAVH